MTHTVDRPKVDERIVKAPPPAPVPPRAGFVRWLGWLLVAALVLGGAGLIWYAASNGSTTAGTPPALADIDLRVNPELKNDAASLLMTPRVDSINPHESPEVMRVPVAPLLSSIDLHDNPEVARNSAIPARGQTADESRAQFEQGIGG